MIYIDALGFILGVLGAILVGQKNYWGFLAFMLHSTCFGILALIDSRYGLLSNCIIFFIIDVYYFVTWRRQEVGN